jgi:hypothetical protein
MIDAKKLESGVVITGQETANGWTHGQTDILIPDDKFRMKLGPTLFSIKCQG